jgi:aerobic-type carbon monoxide dehydrogenase small subunit (CoxS/CutS family)
MPAPALIRLRFRLNAEQVAVQCQPGTRLLDLLREHFGLLGAREGCGRGECGSCLVLMDGRAVNSCLVPAFALADSEVVTSEGLAELKGFAELRKALAAYDRPGCGFCDSGVRIALAALLLSDPHPEPEDVRRALSGNLCACGLPVLSVAGGAAAAPHGRSGEAGATRRRRDGRG